MLVLATLLSKGTDTIMDPLVAVDLLFAWLLSIEVAECRATTHAWTRAGDAADTLSIWSVTSRAEGVVVAEAAIGAGGGRWSEGPWDTANPLEVLGWLVKPWNWDDDATLWTLESS